MLIQSFQWDFCEVSPTARHSSSCCSWMYWLNKQNQKDVTHQQSGYVFLWHFFNHIANRTTTKKNHPSNKKKKRSSSPSSAVFLRRNFAYKGCIKGLYYISNAVGRQYFFTVISMRYYKLSWRFSWFFLMTQHKLLLRFFGKKSFFQKYKLWWRFLTLCVLTGEGIKKTSR